MDTDLQGHNTNPAVVEGTEKMRSRIDWVLSSEDVAEARFSVAAFQAVLLAITAYARRRLKPHRLLQLEHPGG